MGGIKKTNAGPPTFGGGKFPVEQNLGNMDTPMKDPTVTPAPIPEHNVGGRFGSNLVEKDPSAAYNPKGPPSPGVPTHQVGIRFGAKMPLPDKTPALNPTE
jgi:hypothetical protein